MKINHFESLKLKKEIIKLNINGSFYKSYSFHIKFMKNEENKIIFIVKKKLGNAPKRNKIKRQLRAMIANSKYFFEKKIHIMILIKHTFDTTKFHLIQKELNKCLKEIENSI